MGSLSEEQRQTELTNFSNSTWSRLLRQLVQNTKKLTHGVDSLWLKHTQFQYTNLIEFIHYLTVNKHPGDSSIVAALC